MAYRQRPKGYHSGTGNWDIRISGASELAERFGKLSEEIKDFRPAWLVLSRRILDAIRANIASQGAALGHRWPQLKDKYASEKTGQGKKLSAKKAGAVSAIGGALTEAKKRFTGGLLVRTGKLLSGIGVLAQTPNRLKIGVKSPYAAAMNFGSQTNKSLERPFLYSKDTGLPRGVREAAQEEIDKFIRKLLDRVNAAGARISDVSIARVK